MIFFCEMNICRLPWFLLSLAVFPLLLPSPVLAIEELRVLLPVLQEKLTVQLKELASPDALWAGNS
ncbi:hypothetical protein C7K08_14285, partial [Synechococcus lacustris str. Tous]